MGTGAYTPRRNRLTHPCAPSRQQLCCFPPINLKGGCNILNRDEFPCALQDLA